MRVAMHTSLDVKSYKNFMVYFLCQVLRSCLKVPEFSGELLYSMRVKLARRIYKVQTHIPIVITSIVENYFQAVQDILQKRWTRIQSEHAHRLDWHPELLDIKRATNLSIPTLYPYLQSIFDRVANAPKPHKPTFDPPNPLANTADFAKFDNKALSKAVSSHKFTALFDFEQSVQQHLSDWATQNLTNKLTSSIISSCITQYVRAAKELYVHDIVYQSRMALTVMELWMALDRSVTTLYPLILEYSPEIPKGYLEPLLLASSQDIERANTIEQYLARRHTSAEPSRPSVFSSRTSKNAFSIQYFRQSLSLQKLKQTIEQQATQRRNEKIKEMNRLNQEYNRLVDKAKSSVCIQSTGTRQLDKQTHRKECTKCIATRKSNKMKIKLYEWPLPENDLEAEMVVFELRCPKPISLWRDMTYMILHNVGEVEVSDPVSPLCYLDKYDGLSSWSTELKQLKPRIGQASAIKSFVQSHYHSVKLPTSEGKVCVNNSLKFQPYDSLDKLWVSAVCSSLAKCGTFSLPENSLYKHLSFTLGGTAHTPNEVIASQFECPPELSLHEHIAFGSLRSGPHLQWLNILRGMEEGILSFGRYEVSLLHAQAAWQLGPLSEVVCTRGWHVELAKPDFAEKLVSRALRLLGRVRSNWLESTTVGTCVLLVQRVLASQKDLDGATGAREFLIEAINVAFTWVGELTQKLESTVDDSQAQLYRQHLCEIAAVCRSAYNVPPNMLLDLLSNQRGCSPLIVCGIILYENRPQDLGSVPHNLQTLLSRDRILSHRLAPFLMDHILAHPSLLHDSISYVWPAFSPQTGGWVQETHSRSLWLTSTTSLNGRSMQKVDFNLGEGRLLINGLPIGRIPVEYANHSLYVRLFGKRVIEIVPSVIPGMTFTSRSEIEGYQVSFALNSANQGLIIQARADATILELIPPSKLEGDFPSSFSSNFHHWLNVQEKYVEFRPLSKPWSSDKQAWRLCVRDSGLRTMTSTMAYETCSLLDIRSFTYKEISRQLSGLETRQHIHITYSLSSRIRVNLPRFHLTFFLNSDNQLESLNFPEQVVDREQSSGTMIGLSSQLVLRRQDSLGMNQIPRMVIVPEGDVIFATHGHHVKVVINHDNNQHIGYHRYNIDSTLGCLSNSSGLTSRLFRIYLHALTSYCLVDPLTHRTGTEEALQLLSEPATSSFDRLNEAQAQLLGLIGKLTPLRTYYPIHLKCMQSTTWMNLPMFSQHNAFVGYAKSIIGHAGQLQVLHPHEDFEFNQYLGQPSEEALHHRATLRDPEFYPTDTAGISRSAFVQKNDLYFGRDVYRPTSKWSTKEDLASWVTDLAKTHWVRPAYTSYNLVSRLESYGAFHGVQQGISLSYSSQWLSIILESWLSVYHVCRKASVFSRSPFALSFCLSAAAYTDGLSPEIALALVSIATNPRFRKLHPPGHAQYNLQDGYKPTHTNVVELVLGCSKYPVIISSRQIKKKKRKQVPMNDTLSVCATKITESALKQWPNYRPGACAPFAEQFDMEKCNDAIQKYFASCSRNLELRDHLDQVQRFLPDSSGVFNLSLPTAWLAARDLTQLTKHSWDPQLCYDYPPSFNTLFLIRDPPLTSAKLSPASLPPIFTCHNNRFNSTPNTEILENMLREFSRDKMHLLNRRYGADLEASRRCFVAANHAGPCTTITLLSELYLHLDECDKELNAIYNSILASLAPRNIAQQLLASSGIWPRLSPRNILKKLGLHHRASVPQNWIELLADYGLKLIALQRAIRLVYLGAENKHEEIQREIDSTSKNDTLARKNLDWILIQIEGNFSIRNLQAQIALEMISPSSGKNSLMQLNMGEGKSSVIIPVVGATLANGHTLVRVIVIKPLWRAMFHLLVARLGGLAHRKIYYLPFGRHIQPSTENATIIQNLYTQCTQEGGIVLAQPEHILSFKLMGINQLMSSQCGSAMSHLHYIQSWLDSNSRDILDESDEVLNVKYQLVYTVGAQEPLEGHPNRCKLAQELLHSAARCLQQLRSRFSSISICDHPGGRFPLLNIGPNSSAALDLMVKLLANAILDGQLASANLLHLGHNAREAALLFLTDRELTSQAQDSLKAACDPSMWTSLLLLRGLLACGILAFALRDKYYRVNYGLDLSRSLLAVPYIAKDVPSLRAEFGHPDVTILLTCLSYYYKGLSEAQLASCFEMIYKLDNPALEYDHWVLHCGGVPREYATLQGINIKDIKKFQRDIVPLFSYNSAVINFYLSALVFPRSIKEFPHKLVSSAWDLAVVKTHPTTGFSGTNDNRYLLPTTIAQVDPLNQSGTNALILNLLLQPENDHFQCVHISGGIASARDFVDSLAMQSPIIDVLLDVGAQMLDMTNEELARYWLGLRPDALAAVYFNDNDELLVLSQDEGPSRLITSPFAQRLDKCIVYLDDSHTRGTDLKLPRDARGAVTLGPKVTKDRLAQGCMRMRKLGRGQSVMFFAPLEIDNQIRQAVGALEDRPIQTYDVLRWAMLSTCNDLKHHVGHWVQQGQDYGRRLWHEKQYKITGDAKILKSGWLQSESRSVETLYGAVKSSAMTHDPSILEDLKLCERLQYLGVDTIEDSSWDEQQEREVSHEIELERQVERPLPVRPAQHSIHTDLVKMVKTGYFPQNSSSLCSLLELPDTDCQNRSVQNGHLFATVDFVATTLESDTSTVSANYMRPINWIISGFGRDLVILSPYEANALLPQIRSGSAVTLHVYAPRVTNYMVTFSDLNFYRLSSPSFIRPRSTLTIDVRIQLILASGQLYLDDYRQYLAVCVFLGLYVPNSDDAADFVGKVEISSDGFVNPAQRKKLVKYRPEYASCRFKSSPVSMLKDLIGKRRMGMDYMRTHLGQILHGRLLTPEDFN
ncbi:putative large low complexity protein [Rhizoctonia solani 123E]|uniref:ubiquitinyl hydrolase 1 n=1 Tax=Rhizoctonia solani 123E TaxID=1423351 RepID=A0A074RP59_9AGAM|nr:putative large low complexity protein [Rhizoctonia solani 123E]